MRALADRVILATGWSRRLLAFLAGAVGALALAPLDIFPALVVPMTVAVWLNDGAAEGRSRFSLASLRSAAGAGWWWGLGYFIAGMWWLGSAFLLEPEKWAWALPLGVLGFPAVLALFPALGFALARTLWSAGAGRILALAAGLGLTEWLRGFVFTGFPWNGYGMALGDNLVLGQAASLIGVLGLTLIAVAVAAAPATLVDETGAPGRRWPNAVRLAGATLAGLTIFGGLRLRLGEPGTVAGVRLRILQPNLVQDARFRAENKDAILAKYLALSDRATSSTQTGLATVTHLIWPETSLPTILAEDPDVLGRITAALPPAVTLIAGGFRMGTGVDARGRARVFNAIEVVGNGGQILDSYDKVHLVPFGEYMPEVLRRLGVSKFVEIPGDFEPGHVHKALSVPGLPPVAPLICYEAIFSGEVMPQARSPRPGLLLNISNDSWFGPTFGPYQHLAHARLRAIEEGLPLVRGATTGVSAVVDPYGRVVGALPLGVADVLDAPLPRALSETVFARFGLIPAAILWVLFMLGALAWRRLPTPAAFSGRRTRLRDTRSAGRRDPASPVRTSESSPTRPV